MQIKQESVVVVTKPKSLHFYNLKHKHNSQQVFELRTYKHRSASHPCESNSCNIFI